MQEDKDCTFSPETGTAGYVLAASQQPHARESYLDKVERLATLDKQKQDACREATAQQYYAQFSFQPKINERSKRIARVSAGAEAAASQVKGRILQWHVAIEQCN